MTTDHTNPELPDRSDDTEREASAGAQKAAGTDRPFGFWLKLVDRRLSDEMQTLFDADGITRRDWRMLNLLAGEARDERLAERLHSRPHALHNLAERGWIAGAPPVLTEAGREARDRLEVQVRALRERVAGAVSAEDFATTLRSLEAIARELGWDESDPCPGATAAVVATASAGTASAAATASAAGTGQARGTPSGVTRASASRRAAKTSTSTCTCTTTTGVRAAATATAATAVTTGTPRPDPPTRPGALDRVLPAAPSRATAPGAGNRRHVVQLRRTANPIYDSACDVTRPKSSLRLSSP